MSDAQPPKKATNYGNLPSNSKKSADKAERAAKPKDRVIVPITSGTVVQRKKSLGKRISESFRGEDTRSVGSYILFEVVLPAAKDLIVDTATQAIQRMMYGGDARPGTGARRGYTPYNKYGSSVTGSRPMSIAQKPNPRAVHDFSDLVMDNRGAAEDVIDSLNEIIMNYDIATVADLYELVGITGSYTDDKWGWSNMSGARVVRVKDGYLIDLPRTISLDQLD